MEYQSWRSLGARKAIRDRIKADNDWRAYTAGFLQRLDDSVAEVLRLTALASGRVACLVCYEADANRCHCRVVPKARCARLARVRRDVADAVQAAGGPLPVHLRAAAPQGVLPL